MHKISTQEKLFILEVSEDISADRREFVMRHSPPRPRWAIRFGGMLFIADEAVSVKVCMKVPDNRSRNYEDRPKGPKAPVILHPKARNINKPDSAAAPRQLEATLKVYLGLDDHVVLHPRIQKPVPPPTRPCSETVQSRHFAGNWLLMESHWRVVRRSAANRSWRRIQGLDSCRPQSYDYWLR